MPVISGKETAMKLSFRAPLRGAAKRVWRACFLIIGVLAGVGPAQGRGLLIPDDKQVPPLAMVNHQVTITIDDQVAETRVEQTFRNHTSRALEATYVFPVPKGASVRKFIMWVNGKETAGEMVEADKARQIYTDIVRRTQDPGLLEYMGNNLLRLKVFPVAPNADQKVALTYTSVAPRDGDLVEYVYPLKTDGKATRTLEKFSVQATIKSQHPIINVYSPTHSVTTKKNSDREIVVTFEREQGLLDKDFQLFYSQGDKDVGLTSLAHRPVSSENGYFMFLISPRVEMSQAQVIPRDMVLVLDTSGSMRGRKMEQARKALRYCLDNFNPQDRFALIHFATSVTKYKDALTEAGSEQLEQARKWVDQLEATGGTAINDALLAALDFRSADMGRTFTIVFFTDGCPTIGETNTDRILKNVTAKNSANTRIFTFGVGEADGLNATFLDQLAEQTRAVSSFVRPAEDIEVKVSGLVSKISHPVLANLKLEAGNDVRLTDIYPPQLPDLFHGGQLVVMGRYAGKGPAALKLTGTVGPESREFVYETTFPERTNDEKAFVEHVWARRKVGYMLDQIRLNGEKKELVDEVTLLAKKYGIATPYTSYLIVPDGPMPILAGVGGRPNVSFNGASGGPAGGFGGGGLGAAPPALKGGGAGAAAKPQQVTDFARRLEGKDGSLPLSRAKIEEEQLRESVKNLGDRGGEADKKALFMAITQKEAYDEAHAALKRRDLGRVQTEKLGVELSLQMNNLRNQSRLSNTALRQVAGRNCLEFGGVWIDEGFNSKMLTLTIQAQSDAYFKLLERHPEIKSVLQLGNYLVWVAPSGTALVIDANDGKKELTDSEIDKLFEIKK
jgi:Ca-activated chloride channel family protein